MKSEFDAASELWSVEVKIGAIAQVIQAYNFDVQAEDMDFYGLGLIVLDLASEIQKIRNQIEQSYPSFDSVRKTEKNKNYK